MNKENKCEINNKNSKELLLHACCGPCSLEPYKYYLKKGWIITIYYTNNNIYPQQEYEKRLDVLKKWCADNNINLIYSEYNHPAWLNEIKKCENYQDLKNKDRCFLCYKHRLDKSAQYAVKNNIKYIATTLSVSPYQDTKSIEKNLLDTSKKYNLNAVFDDFRPYYSNATKKSTALNMYRQKYCGCEFSLKESILMQQKAKKIKEQKRKKKQELDKQIKARKEKIKSYQDKKARQKVLLKKYKEANK